MKLTGNQDDTALLISTLLCSNIRDCLKPTSKIKALELLLTVSCYLKDETKLDRIIPYMVDLLSDTNANVRAATLRTITQILLIVGGITPANSTVFIEYLLPLIMPLVTDESELVRSMFAQCISPIAETGQKFLDLAESMKSNNTYTANEGVEKMLLDGNESFENSYEASSQDLQMFIQDAVATLLTDKSSMVKRSLLQDIIPLCLFFGPAKSNDLLLTHINTYLNDRDWELRSAFFDSVVGIATCVGGKCVEEYILPLVIQALADPEENVIVNVLNSIRKLAELGLFKKVHIWELIGMTFALLVHPNVCIRQNVIEFISAAVSRLPETDTWCIIYPQLTTLISGQISRVDVDSLSEAVLPPLSRKLFVIAQEWSLKVPKSPFWKTGTSTSPIGVKEGLRSLRASLYQSGSQVSPKVDTHICDEDKPFIDRMTLNGFTKEDEVKLRYLRSHIMMLAKAQESKLSEVQRMPQPDINNVIALSDLKVAPQTVFIGLRNSNLVSGTLEANFKSRSNLSKQRSIESWSRQISTLSQRSTPVSEYAKPPVQIPNRGDVMDLRKRLAQPPASVQALAEPTKAMDVSRRESTTTLETMHSTSPKMADLPGFDGASPPEPGSHAGSPLISYIRPPRRGPLPSDGQKAAPAIGSISTNALGMLEIPRRDNYDDGGMNSGGATPISAGGIISKAKLPSNQTQYHHTYEGKDPAILMMLDNVCKESLKEPLSEFGNKVTPPLLKRKKSAVLNDDDGFSMRMVGQFKEHTSAITSIVVSPDHLFFVTGSSDHTVKVWDTTRLEKNVTSKSRHTLKRGEAVKALCVIQDTHCIAVACKDGTIAIFRVDVSVGTNLPKYASELCIVREFNVKFASDGEYITWMFHYSNGRLYYLRCRNSDKILDLSSNLVYTTSFSRLCIVDLRNNQDMLELEAPVSHGPILSACIDSTRSWVVTGSLFGHLCLWDIRFGMIVHTWMSRREGSINQIEIEPSSEELILVSVSDTAMSNTVIEVHNVATKQVVDVYESQPLGECKRGRERQNDSTVKAIDDIIKVGKETQNTVPLESESARSFLIGPASKKSGGMWYSYATAQAHAAAQLNTSAWVLEDSKNKNARKERKKFLIIGTNSQQIKCWNLDSDWHKSKILSGGHKDVRYVMRVDDDGRELHCEERVTQENKRTNRSLLVNEQNDRLLSSHNQSVEALAAIEVPFRALISGDRGGIFKLWRVD
ncbi:ARM repeat-containing protein [Wallemia mellicola]|nr:ARM repeat-containing protein [Wallemia mellicola]